MMHPVHHDRLAGSNAELTQFGHASDFPLHRVKLKRQPKRAREIRESPAGRVEELRGGSESGDSHGADLLRARGKDVEQPRPLETLHDIEVDNMDAILPFQGLEDSLVRSEVRELHQRFRGQRRVRTEAGAHHTRLQRLREVSPDALRRGTERRREFGDLREEVVGEVEFIHGDALGTLEEEAKKLEAGGLAGVRVRIEGLVVVGGGIGGEVGPLERRLIGGRISGVNGSLSFHVVRVGSAGGSRDQALKHDRWRERERIESFGGNFWGKSDKTERERQGKF
ncbi:hypothetical protein V8G54_025060 [Vigna mungo]|uniref:Uncharacterized protein n=1 Tax=Vigna mungo TaxID=3915 RepID=A0AAQ3RQP6_VIGMU